MSSRTRKKRLTLVAILTTVLVLSGGTAAFAYWTAQGTGAGNATAGTTVAFTVAGTTPSGTSLSPGSSQTVTFTVHNPGAGPQRLSNVVVTVASAGGAAWTAVAGCSSADYTVGTPTIVYSDIAGSGDRVGTVVITMVNNPSASQDGCKNASVPLYFVAS